MDEFTKMLHSAFKYLLHGVGQSMPLANVLNFADVLVCHEPDRICESEDGKSFVMVRVMLIETKEILHSFEFRCEAVRYTKEVNGDIVEEKPL